MINGALQTPNESTKHELYPEVFSGACSLIGLFRGRNSFTNSVFTHSTGCYRVLINYKQNRPSHIKNYNESVESCIFQMHICQ